MTELLFRDDGYLRSCTARLVGVDERGIRLDRTVFYPTGGGQPGDTGMLRLASGGEIAIVDTVKGEGPDEVIHVPAPGGQITRHGQFLGTPDYMSPEQCLDCHAVDGRADIYALGCTLYELLTGQPPFAGPDHGSVYLKMKAHVEAPVPPIRGRRPDVPERLAAALERMLAKDRAGRFASAAGVVAALQHFAAGADLAGLSLSPPPSTIIAA